MKTIKEAKESVGELISFSRGINWTGRNSYGFDITANSPFPSLPPSQVYFLLSVLRVESLIGDYDAFALMNKHLKDNKTDVMCRVLYAGKICVILSHINSIELSTQNS
jgi:hypothetical protein